MRARLIKRVGGKNAGRPQFLGELFRKFSEGGRIPARPRERSTRLMARSPPGAVQAAVVANCRGGRRSAGKNRNGLARSAQIVAAAWRGRIGRTGLAHGDPPTHGFRRTFRKALLGRGPIAAKPQGIGNAKNLAAMCRC